MKRIAILLALLFIAAPPAQAGGVTIGELKEAYGPDPDSIGPFFRGYLKGVRDGWLITTSITVRDTADEFGDSADAVETIMYEVALSCQSQYTDNILNVVLGAPSDMNDIRIDVYLWGLLENCWAHRLKDETFSAIDQK